MQMQWNNKAPKFFFGKIQLSSSVFPYFKWEANFCSGQTKVDYAGTPTTTTTGNGRQTWLIGSFKNYLDCYIVNRQTMLTCCIVTKFYLFFSAYLLQMLSYYIYGNAETIYYLFPLVLTPSESDGFPIQGSAQTLTTKLRVQLYSL